MRAMSLVRSNGRVVVLRPDGEPLPLTHIVAIGRNYPEHAAEMARAAGAEAGAGGPAAAPGTHRPIVFAKNPSSIALDGEAILIPKVCQQVGAGLQPSGPGQDDEFDRVQVDYEAELAVIVGEAARDLRPDDVAGVLLGYCCANDVSARWWQRHGAGGQFYRGKSFDTFCPLGPVVVPAAVLGDAGDLGIRCRLNGELVQDSRTSQMRLGVVELMVELSRDMTLLPGTVVLTGTPAGVGAGRTPPRFLRPGDRVEVEIEGVGVLRNEVRCARG